MAVWNETQFPPLQAICNLNPVLRLLRGAGVLLSKLHRKSYDALISLGSEVHLVLQRWVEASQIM